ncbi:MAG: hypothetical protein AAFY11_09560 [Cyanobacteria bacterium J06641_5]
MTHQSRHWQQVSGAIAAIWVAIAEVGAALPPPDDIPEDVLRVQVILEGRSRVDGRPLSPVEYLAEEEDLATANAPRKLDPDIRELVFLLQLLKFLRTVTPFF